MLQEAYPIQRLGKIPSRGKCALTNATEVAAVESHISFTRAALDMHATQGSGVAEIWRILKHMECNGQRLRTNRDLLDQ
jgi:hypothetical protein